jgi:hypothetical protein
VSSSELSSTTITSLTIGLSRQKHTILPIVFASFSVGMITVTINSSSFYTIKQKYRARRQVTEQGCKSKGIP